MKKTILHAVAFLSLAASLPSAAQELSPVLSPALSPVSARNSDQQITLDQQAYRSWQARIQGLNDKGVRVGDYALSKAQCWLDVSLHEYTRNDRSAFPQLALQQSAAIIQALENKTSPNPAENTPLINDAAKLREDLWAQFARLKGHAGYACAAQKVACAEVELVHAGNELKQQGWRHANPYIQIAEGLLQAANESAEKCLQSEPPQPPQPPKAPEECKPCATPPAAKEVINLAADALFAFDKSSLADLLPEGRAKIDDMMQKLDRAYASIERINLVGYTDRLGGVSYNQALSERRAATIGKYLQQKGYQGQIQTSGKGKAEQLVACSGVQPKAKLVACLQPNRRVMIEVVGVKR